VTTEHAKPDEPLVMLVRALASYDDDPRRIVHANRLADLLAERLQGTADETLGDRIWVDDCVNTLTRLLAHLATQQVADRQRIDVLDARVTTIEQALMVTNNGTHTHMVQFQQFANETRTMAGELNSETFLPLITRLTNLQNLLATMVEELKRVQQAIIALQEHVRPDDHAS
jgi:hypothetical protein